MLEFRQDNFQNEVLDSELPVLVDFWAPWCGPCRRMTPILEEIAAAYGEKLRVGKVNIEDHRELATEYGIMSIPTVGLFSRGKMIMRLVGFQQKGKIKAALQKYLPN